jgi:8-amino-7-oxononanoate synthase
MGIATKEERLAAGLQALRDEQAERRLRTLPSTGGTFEMDGRPVLNFASNDYLDLARHPHVVACAAKALQDFGAGATASRLLAGSLPLHETLETRLASFKGCEAALLFGSGYMANLGLLPALASDGDVIVADRLVHASVIDGALLSRARLARFRHNDAGHLRELLAKAPEARKLVVTESVFSMDGDLAPLADIAAAAADHGAFLVVDEAHATGVFGPKGAGRVAELHLQDRVDAAMFTLSKALGGSGGAVALRGTARQWLVNRARSFIYTTAPPPAVLGAALGALDLLDQDPGLGARLLERARLFRSSLVESGLDVAPSASQIVPVMTRTNETTMAVAKRLEAHGILSAAIRPPTVPEGTARLRFSVTLAHTPENLARAAESIAAAVREETPA